MKCMKVLFTNSILSVTYRKQGPSMGILYQMLDIDKNSLLILLTILPL